MKQTLFYDGSEADFVALINIWIRRYQDEGAQDGLRCFGIGDGCVYVVKDDVLLFAASPGNSVLVDLDTGDLKLV